MDAQIEGITRKYQGNGRKLGYPTANIAVETDLEDGVYFGFAHLDGFDKHPAVVFIGTPTTEGVADPARRAEAHLLGIPDVDYYDQHIVIDIKHFHRPNQKFGSVDDLIKAIESDDQAAREWFTKTE